MFLNNSMDEVYINFTQSVNMCLITFLGNNYYWIRRFRTQKMVKICAVKSCSSRRKNKTKIKDVSSVSFFQPTSQTRLEAWSKSLGMKLKPSDFVCQLHFNKDDIKFNYKVVRESDVHFHYLKKKILRKHALPTVEYQEQYYPVKSEEEEESEERGRRLDTNKKRIDITKSIAYLKHKLSGLPQHWSYVEKPNEIEFLRIDPKTKKVRNHLVLKEDFSIMVILPNNKKIYLDEQISSPNDFYEYLKLVDDWTPCVGTRIQSQKYSKQCKGIISLDENSGRSNIYPRCKPCKILRYRLRNGLNTPNIIEDTTINREIGSESILRQRLSAMEKPMMKEEYQGANSQQIFSRPQPMAADVDVDLDNIAGVKKNFSTLWSSPQFCGLCYYNGDCCPLNTELVINRQKFSKCLRDIVNYVFNDDVANIMSSSYICDNCVEKSIQAYIFIHNTKQMSRIMNNAVTDMYSKVNDVSNQLSPSLDYDNANIMIVLENDTATYKSLINNKINEITPTSKPIPMTIESSKNDTQFIKMDEIDENLKEDSDEEQGAKSVILSKTEYLETDKEMIDFENPDHNYDYTNDEIKITKFFPINIPTTIKKSEKIELKQIKRISAVTLMNESPKFDKVFSISKLKEIRDKNIKIIPTSRKNRESPKSNRKYVQINRCVTPILNNQGSPNLVITKKIQLNTEEKTPEILTSNKNDNIPTETAPNVTLKKGHIIIKPLRT